MNRILEILAIVIPVLLVVSVVTMPWPANAVIGCLLLVTVVVAVTCEMQHRKKS